MKRWLRSYVFAFQSAGIAASSLGPKAALALAMLCIAVAMPVPGYSETIVDTLAGATPEMTFSVFGTSGVGIFSEQLVGSQFLLTQRSKLTEIGAFLNNCASIVSGVPQCPGPLPFAVQIRRSVNGTPEPTGLIAVFALSHDDNPLVTSYERVQPDFVLEPGVYFALFGPQQPADAGSLLAGAPGYLAGLATLGFLNPSTGSSFASAQYGAVRILAVPAVQTVAIDIKPGSDPNSINLSSAGVIPVAILSSNTFDALTVNPDTVSLAGARVKLVGKTGKPLCHEEDVNGDGLLDLVCQVVTADFMIEEGDSVAVLEAVTFGGAPLRGEDSLRIVRD